MDERYKNVHHVQNIFTVKASVYKSTGFESKRSNCVENGSVSTTATIKRISLKQLLQNSSVIYEVQGTKEDKCKDPYWR